jgi:hypothetical protein
VCVCYQKYLADGRLIGHVQEWYRREIALEDTKNTADLRECFPKEASTAEFSTSSLLAIVTLTSDLPVPCRAP